MSDDYYEDKEIKCNDCGQDFTWTGGEQRYYAEKNFSQPKRCKPCRDKRKKAKEDRERRQEA